MYTIVFTCLHLSWYIHVPAEGEGGSRGWDACLASWTQYTWVCKLWEVVMDRDACCHSWGHRAKHDLVTEQQYICISLKNGKTFSKTSSEPQVFLNSVGKWHLLINIRYQSTHCGRFFVLVLHMEVAIILSI